MKKTVINSLFSLRYLLDRTEFDNQNPSKNNPPVTQEWIKTGKVFGPGRILAIVKRTLFKELPDTINVVATHFPSWPCSLKERKRDGVFLKNVSYAYISTGNTCKGRPGRHFAVEEASCQKN